MLYLLFNRIKNILLKLQKPAGTCFLYDYEIKITSQNNEDGVLEKIFDIIGATNKFYVEFGVEDGIECNTRYLREKHGFHGLLMDGNCENETINLNKEMVFAENINTLFEKYNVPTDLDLLSIDIDFNDFWVLKALDAKYQPRVLVLEINTLHSPDKDLVVPYNKETGWDGTNYFGGSLLAMTKLARYRGYELVYMEERGVNAFYIRRDILSTLNHPFSFEGNIEKIYRYPGFSRRRPWRKGHRAGPKGRPYITSGY